MFVLITYQPIDSNRVIHYEIVNSVPSVLGVNRVAVALNTTNIPIGFYESFNQYQIIQSGSDYSVGLISGQTETKRSISETTASLVADQNIPTERAQAILNLPWTVVRSNQISDFAVL